jgi:hypothetical protein
LLSIAYASHQEIVGGRHTHRGSKSWYGNIMWCNFSTYALLVKPRIEEQPKQRRDEEIEADDIKQQLGAEKESSKKILDQLFGSEKKSKKENSEKKSDLAHATEKKGKKEKTKVEQPEVSSNWMKLKVQEFFSFLLPLDQADALGVAATS